MLYVDLPTPQDLRKIVAATDPASVSFYLTTYPETQKIEASRIQLGNLLKEAEGQLEAMGTPKRSIWPIVEQVQDLLDEDDFWRLQANSLAIFVSPDRLRSYRLPTQLHDMVQVSDRFHLKPLLRAVSVPQHAFVLALEENQVRLIEVTADLPAREVRVPDMPKDAASAVGTSTVNSRSASGRVQGGEGQKMRLRQFARKVDEALRTVLGRYETPLILAAAEPLRSIYQSVNSYAALSAHTIDISPAQMNEADLATASRPVLDAEHAEKIKEFFEVYSARENEARATTDVSHAARAATFGAVDTILVDIDAVLPGAVDPESGAVSFAEAESGDSYGVVDEIAGRVLLQGGKVYGVRAADLPDGAALAAILRYAV